MFFLRRNSRRSGKNDAVILFQDCVNRDGLDTVCCGDKTAKFIAYVSLKQTLHGLIFLVDNYFYGLPTNHTGNISFLQCAFFLKYFVKSGMAPNLFR